MAEGNVVPARGIITYRGPTRQRQTLRGGECIGSAAEAESGSVRCVVAARLTP